MIVKITMYRTPAGNWMLATEGHNWRIDVPIVRSSAEALQAKGVEIKDPV